MAPRAASLLVLLSLVCYVQSLTLMWPNFPAVGDSPSVQWSDGTPPYTMNVLDTNTTEITYSYTGNDNFTFWVVDVVAGTVVTFEVIDSTQLSVTSTPITVLPNAASVSVSQASVSQARISSLSVSLYSASIASLASLSSISVTSVQGSPTNTQASPGSTISSGASPTTSSGGSSGGGGKSSNTGAIVGGVVGGILGLALLGLLAFYLITRRRLGATGLGLKPNYDAVEANSNSDLGTGSGSTPMMQMGGAGAAIPPSRSMSTTPGHTDLSHSSAGAPLQYPQQQQSYPQPQQYPSQPMYQSQQQQQQGPYFDGASAYINPTQTHDASYQSFVPGRVMSPMSPTPPGGPNQLGGQGGNRGWSGLPEL